MLPAIGWIVSLAFLLHAAAHTYGNGNRLLEAWGFSRANAAQDLPPGANAPSGAPHWADQFSKELSIGSPAAGGLDKELIASIRQSAQPSVVHIVTFDATGTPIGNGTGFFVADGLVATSLHIVRDATTWSMSARDRKPVIAPVRIRSRSKPWNLAVLETEEDLPSLQVEATADPAPGDPVLVVGSASDGTLSSTPNRIGRERNSGGALRYSLANRISPGSSGAPIFGAQAALIGVATFTLNGSRFESLLTPVSALNRLIPRTKTALAQAGGGVIVENDKKNIRNHVSLAKYEKTLHSSKEKLTVQNKTERPINNLKFLLTYKDMKGRTIRSRKLTFEGTIPAQKEKTAVYVTPDRLRPYEYIHGKIVLGENLYDIEILPLEYETEKH